MNEQENPETEMEDVIVSSFVGHEKIFAHLTQYIRQRSEDHAFALVGRKRSGKTAILRQFSKLFPDETISMYFDLSDVSRLNVFTLSQILAQAMNETLNQASWYVAHIPEIPEVKTGEWFVDEYLDDIVQVIRPHRRIVWLFDNAHVFFDFNHPPETVADLTAHLQKILSRYPQVGIVMAFEARFEALLEDLQPLLHPNKIERILRFSIDDTRALLTAFNPNITEYGVQEIYKVSGGFPVIVHTFGKLFEDEIELVMVEQVKKIVPQVYEQVVPEFEELWQTLSANERHVLIAMSNLFYDDPLQPLTLQKLENWIVQTDLPLDSTTIRSALRSLEYQEILSGSMSDLKLISNMLAKWVLEKANPINTTQTFSSISSRSILIGTVLLLGLLILALVLTNNFTSDSESSATVFPTITLNPEPTSE